MALQLPRRKNILDEIGGAISGAAKAITNPIADALFKSNYQPQINQQQQSYNQGQQAKVVNQQLRTGAISRPQAIQQQVSLNTPQIPTFKRPTPADPLTGLPSANPLPNVRPTGINTQPIKTASDSNIVSNVVRGAGNIASNLGQGIAATASDFAKNPVKETGDTIQSLARAPARGLASLAREFGDKSDYQSTPLRRAVFGDEPIKSFTQQGQDLANLTESSNDIKANKNVATNPAVLYALGAASAVSDVLPGGSGKKRVLKKAGAVADEAKTAGEELIKKASSAASSSQQKAFVDSYERQAARNVSSPPNLSQQQKELPKVVGKATNKADVEKQLLDSIPKNQLYEKIPEPNLTPITNKYTPRSAKAELQSRGVKTFAPLDDDSAVKVASLVRDSESSPVRDGFTRLYQTNDGDTVKSDQFFKDPLELANYVNGRSANAKLAYVDVPNESVLSTAGKPRVFRAAQEQENKALPVARKADNNLDPLTKTEAEYGNGQTQIPLEVTNAGTVNGEFQRAITDKDAALINYLKQVERNTGKKGLVDQFYYDSGLQRRSNSIANAQVQNSGDIQKALGGLRGNDKKEFDTYAAARNELSNAQKGLPTSQPIESLQATVSSLDAKHGERFTALNNFYQDWAKRQRDAGLIDEPTYQSFMANKDYSRIQRDMTDLANPRGRGGNAYSLGTPTARQKRKGSARAIQPADITALNYAQKIQSEIQRNQTSSNLIDVLESQGHARLVKDTTRKNTISRVVNGKTEIYEIPRDIKEVVDQITPYQLGVLGRIISAPQRLLRAGATGLSAPFTVANYVKDQVGSAVFSKNFLATHTPASVFDGVYQAFKDFGTGNDSELWQRFIQHSGDTTSVDFIRNIKNGKDISREIRMGQGGRAINKIKNPIRTLEDLNQITERATRFQNFKGIYNDVLKKTGDKNEATRQATLAAWQNSTDFSRAGNVSQVLNLLLPYFNASVQGTRTLGRKVVQNPIGTTAKILSFVGLPVAAAAMYNTSDPQRKAIYDNISDYEKENNVIVILPGAKQEQDGSYSNVIKVPLQQGISNLVQPLRHAAESFNNSNQADAAKMTAEFLGAVSGPVNISSPSQAAGGLIPQAVKPLVQQAANQDFYTGKQIVPDFVNEATDAQGNAIPEGEKTLPYTSGSAELLGKAIGVSPIRVEKFIKDTSGKVGQYTQNAVDQGLAKVGAIPQDKVGGVNAISDTVRRFGSAQGKENFQKSEGAKYFDRVKQATDNLNVNEKAAFSSLHPASKNFKGDVITDTDSLYDPAARLDVYNRYPRVFEADKKLDAQNRAQGKPGNPLFDLDPTLVKKVLEKDNLPPGAKDPELSNLYKKEWYSDYQAKRSAFFDAINKQSNGKLTASSQKNPYPDTPPALQKVMDTYSSLPSGTGAKSAWIKANPGAWQAMQDQYAKVDTWQNNKRLGRGLDATEGAVGEAAGYTPYTQSSSKKSSGGSNSVGSAYKYAVRLDAGGEIAKPTVKAKGTATTKAGRYKARASSVSRPKVTMKKSTA